MSIIQRVLAGSIDLAALHQRDKQRFPLLLQSIAGGNALSRWDMLLVANGEGIVCRDGQSYDLHGQHIDGKFLDAFDSHYLQHAYADTESELPFTGGWAMYLGYELAAQIEPSVRFPSYVGPLPDALALRSPAALLHDKHNHQFYIVCESSQQHLMQDIENAIELANTTSVLPAWPNSQMFCEEPDAQFTAAVYKILQYIQEGDVFQVNVSRSWDGVFEQANGHSLYQRLCAQNPAPFAGFLQFEDWQLISSSPERLVSVQDHKVQTRPIAGTRPRLHDDNEQHKIQELVGHPKERAEHVMLIDLERNDLARVCVPGSVHVDELMVIESYSHVHHIVSNVCGQLIPKTTPGQLLAAIFPGGTITGCPKVRCMQIIAELEGTGRGPYTGALGYVNGNGGMDLNILIRSISLANDRVQLRAGAGIVFDSVPELELQETRAKAKGLLRALGVQE